MMSWLDFVKNNWKRLIILTFIMDALIDLPAGLGFNTEYSMWFYWIRIGLIWVLIDEVKEENA